METPETSRLYSTDHILSPECMSLQDIKQFLIVRGILPKDLPSDRGGLLSLYNRLILPLPQREYKKSSRIGKKFRRKSSDKEFISGSSSTHNNSNGSGISSTHHQPQSKSFRNVPDRDRDRHNLKTKHDGSKEAAPDSKKSRLISWP